MLISWQPTLLKNEWVELRPLEPTDFEALYEVASDPLIWEQHPNPNRYQRPVFQTYFEGAIASKGAFLIKDTIGQIIGCSRFYDHDPPKKEVKIGYTFFDRSCWGKPYNRNTKALMLDYAFQFVEKVVFEVGAGNIRSQKAMEKLGAVRTGEEMVTYFGETPKLNVLFTIQKPS